MSNAFNDKVAWHVHNEDNTSREAIDGGVRAWV